jgi:exodeoxyribonuclease V beta subunit
MSAAGEYFDMAQSSVERGVTLLEAGAGSGKTFAIEGLFLRLVAGEGIPLREILVCTFTNAATAELRSRIRGRLLAAHHQLRDGAVEDPALTAVLGGGVDAQVAHLRIAQALESMDQAQIFTIHGFCGRILSEHAFESGGAFQHAEVDDGSQIALRAARDFSRRAKLIAPLACLCLSAGIKRKPTDEEDAILLDNLCASAYRLRGADRDVEISPDEAASPGLEACEVSLLDSLARIRARWTIEKDEVMAFASDAKRAKSDLRKGAASAALALDELCAGSLLTDGTIGAIRLFTSGSIAGNVMTRPKAYPPDCRLFAECQSFFDVLAASRTAYVRSFLREVDGIVDAFRRDEGTLGHDDLIYKTAKALRPDGADSLARTMRRRYRAALVDEFQDTDSLQWSIFSRIFACDREHYLFIIGDPKQAIYRFRGADVHAYMDAAASADRAYALDRNWRSDPPLVEAVNALFSATPKPFGTGGIEFAPAIPAAKPDPRKSFVPGERLPVEPLRIILRNGLPGNKDGQCEWIFDRLCRDVSEMLASGSTIGGRPLAGGDIAVLVRTGEQARGVLDALTACAVRAVLQSDDSVFDSRAAEWMADLLAAALRPGRRGLAAWILAGPIFGKDGEEIRGLVQGGADELSELLPRFASVWADRGVMSAWRDLETRTGLRAGLAARPGGERELADLLHLAELLNVAERAGRFSPEALLRWFVRMRDERNSRPKGDDEIRLEGDSDAVRIVTAHKSKGLEFPVVILPFAGLEKKHDPGFVLIRESGRNVLHLEPDEDALAAESAESSQDETRLMYVSLTRARNRCLVYVPCPEGSPPACPTLSGILGAEGWKGICEALGRVRAACPQGVAVEHDAGDGAVAVLPVRAGGGDLVCRSFTRQIDRRPMVTSFSAICAGRAAEEAAELPERMDLPVPLVPAEAELEGLAAFPKGAGAGTFFHACLERLDFADRSKWREIVSERLAAAGMDVAKWLDVVVAGIGAVVDNPMGPEGVVLAGKGEGDLLRECEFYIPAMGPDPAILAAAFAGAGGPFADCAPMLACMRADGADGYLKGYVDLLFRHEGRTYILDWKSNWLGRDTGAYTAKAMHAAMLEHAYHLQGCLYAAALRRALAGRGEWDAERFGGILYVFLRGVDPAVPGGGVVYFRPGETLLDGIDEALAKGGVR